MNDPGLMGRRNSFCNLNAGLEDGIQRHRFPACQMRPQCAAVYVFSRYVMDAVRLADLVNGKYVRMIEGGCRFRLLDKSGQLVCVFTELFVQKLDRHLSTELCVLGKIDLAHAARTDL